MDPSSPSSTADGSPASSEAERLLLEAWQLRSSDLEETRQRTLQIAERLDLDARSRATAERNLGFVALRRADYDSAEAHLERGLALATTANAPALAGDCLAYRAMVHSARGAYGRAIALQSEALALRERLGDDLGIGQSLGNLGVLHGYLGDFAASLEHHRRALEYRERTGDERGRALTLNNIGVAYFELGEVQTALEHHRRALEAARAVHEPQVAVYAQVNLAADLLALGRPAETLGVSREALTEAEAIGDRESCVEALGLEARARLATGIEAEAAMAGLEAALTEARALGNPALEYRCLADLGAALLEAGRLEVALMQLEAALSVAERVGWQRGVYLTHEQLSLAHERLGNAAAALHHHRAFHAVERAVQGERAAIQAKTLALRFEADRARQEARFERQRSDDLARANTALRRADEEKSALMDQLRHQASHDALTGLANRELFRDRLERAVTVAARYRRCLGVLFIDLDGFKLVNDTLGHHRGDELLIEVARRLQAVVRDSDTVARMGGDEFTVILGELRDAEDAARVAQRLLAALEAPVVLHGHSLRVTASLGVALFPQDGSTAFDLSQHADLALYHAKDEGKNTLRFYAPELNRAVQERMELATEMNGALERGEFALHYQPLLDADGAVRCAEALLRWTHPSLGRVAPDRFIQIAEDNGLIVALGGWVLREALAQLVAWRALGSSVQRVAVNVSPVQLARADFVDTVTSALETSGLSGSNLELEVTERVVVRDLQRVAERLEALRALGVRIAVDDFGAGHSSLAYLARLPVDILKIDRDLVARLKGGDAGGRLVAATVALARALGLDVVAEGVESESVLAALREFGCARFQGYLWTEPRDAAEFERWRLEHQSRAISPG